MMTLLNEINWHWNRCIYWMHDTAARTRIGWLVTLSIWAYDRLTWRLPDRWQLVCGVPLVEYTLRHELELARHQARWYAEYANDLQWAMLLAESTEPDEAGVLEAVQ
jgi:hypothetical protein